MTSYSNCDVKAIFLMGPTATGKTQLALELSEHYPIEIISVDSALIYTDMDIGTAKPTPNELSQVPHHLINLISPLQSYSVAEFIHACNSLILEICARGKLPLLVGGTMMYFNALINGVNQLPESDSTIRAELTAKLHNHGTALLYNDLINIDPEAASKIMAADTQRIIRALEVFYITGSNISKLQKAQSNILKLSNNVQILPLMILPSNREILHDRINQRFLNMLDHGFIDEVLAIKAKYSALTANHSSMRCVGYYQVWQYLDNMISYQQLIDTGSAATRQLAKRQSTWLKKLNGINLYLEETELSITSMKKTAFDKFNQFL